MKKDSRYPWYWLDIIIFLLINLVLWWYFESIILNSISSLSGWTLFLLAAAVWRFTDTLTHENVTEIFRKPFEGSLEGFKGFVAKLIVCNSCTGVWVSLVFFYGYVFFPILTLAFAIIMTLTFLERFFSKIYNLLERRG